AAVPFGYVVRPTRARVEEETARVEIAARIERQRIDIVIRAVAQSRPRGAVPFGDVVGGGRADIVEPSRRIEVAAAYDERCDDIVGPVAHGVPGAAVPPGYIIHRYYAGVGEVAAQVY